VKNLVFQDPSCYSGNLDHTVLVVGYDSSNLFPYWVVRNWWGDAWCTGGYMRVGHPGRQRGVGDERVSCVLPGGSPSRGPLLTPLPLCQMGTTCLHSTPAGGTCKPAPTWGNYSYTCTCPTGFAPVNNTVNVTLPGAGQGITQTCAPVDACGLTLSNPCSVGTCVNDGKGSYSCLCPPGY